MPFSAVLTHHIALHDAELDPISAYGHINSAVALTALGRTDEASAAIARAAAIEPDARWVAVLRTLTEAASGALKAASTDADALLGRESLKTMPVWVPSMLELIKAEAGGDERARAHAVATLREPARQGRATLFELSYLSAIAAPFLAREGRADDALALLADVTAQSAPPPYDIVVMNPSLRRVMDDPRARPIAASSSAQFTLLLKAIDAARTAGRFPLYLERPLQDLRSTLRDSGRAD
jgi:hypothetical protein